MGRSLTLYTSSSAEETIDIGYQIGLTLSANDIVCLEGDLAAGKTTLMKGIAASVAHCPQEQVNSPTFVYLNIYKGKTTIYHFDLYRFSHHEQFLYMGFDDFLFAGGICCIEWSERISCLLPQNCLSIQLTHIGENKRQITII